MYLVSFECGRCGNDARYGPLTTLVEDRHGLPVIPLSVVEDTFVECNYCGTAHHFGELDVYVESTRGPRPNEEDDRDV